MFYHLMLDHIGKLIIKGNNPAPWHDELSEISKFLKIKYFENVAPVGRQTCIFISIFFKYFEQLNPPLCHLPKKLPAILLMP
jgi:hypothetical protein